MRSERPVNCFGKGGIKIVAWLEAACFYAAGEGNNESIINELIYGTAHI